MSESHTESLTLSMTNAIDELMTMIKGRYPDAQFEVMHGIDDPESIHLTATVDIDETEDILDLVIDRILEFQIDEQLPIHVIPLRPLESIIKATRPTIAHV